ncbi:toll/interleukin-1 receptor domain-containing protein [Stenotrophomonas sp. 169]|uniref:toll/interleukin-1 receptor domain-containing protein n=1 Tax=Stenotrophomonas sp. 169 TaxID=2770322 RepID=UPI0016621E8A|nr:toll/interleukin-1 receptor domain-containing protein [Stenotrophomonas sp. 169]QNR96652.1 toll/interleukin-1 receptor domain-containing protein [Stenotrophomonas sp. 169]
MDLVANNPKVFVSHASEDKDSFVLEFATKLRAHGVDAWVDKWEMLPGDKLIHKIFEEGLKAPDAFIIVLSTTSVTKPWVREELDVAAVKRISNGMKLIPVVIDDCQIPGVLTATLYEKFDRPENYNASFDRVLSAIFNLSSKPPLGALPAYAHPSPVRMAGRSASDSLVIHVACEKALEDEDQYVYPVEAFDLNGSPKLPVQELRDCLEILEDDGAIESLKGIDPGIRPFRITESGFELYAREAIPGYSEMRCNVVRGIVNSELTSNIALSEHLGLPVYLTNHILSLLEHEGGIKLTKGLQERQTIYHVGASLRRELSA